MLDDVLPCEVLFVTSRALAVDQQAAAYDSLIRLTPEDDVVSYWRGDGLVTEPDLVRITTYDKLQVLLFGNDDRCYNSNALQNVKVVILDEIHSVFCDTFIESMKAIQVWLSHEILLSNRTFFGLTATPGIVYRCAPLCNIPLNPLNNPLYRYKARHLWCVDTDEAVRLINEELPGKTIVMCRHSRTCYWLQKRIPGSVVLSSKNGEDYITCEMNNVRSSIVHRFTLPSDVQVLIATETVREGFTFIEDSGIKNVVSFFSDEINIHQFVGRCRYDVDNLLIVDTRGNYQTTGYVGEQRKLFRDFCADRSQTDWFNSISDILVVNPEDVVVRLAKVGSAYHKIKKPQEKNPSISKYRKKTSPGELKKYVEDNWLVPDKFIYGEIKKEIVKEVSELKIFTEESKINSWGKLEKVLKDEGFEIVNTRKRINKQLVRCKQLVGRKEG